jgi:hypothetical protein
MSRLDLNLAGKGTSRAERRQWRAELAGWEPKHAAATRALAALRAPEIATIDTEERHLGERLSDLWGQRDTHQRWTSDHPEGALRLNHLAGEIDSLSRTLGDDARRPDRAPGFDERWEKVASIAHERSPGLDLGR